MTIFYLFTYNNSLSKWEESGLLEREILFFEKMNKNYGINFIFFTFGNKNDLIYQDKYDYIKVIPIFDYLNESKNKLINFLKIIFSCSSIVKNSKLNFDIIQTNQLYGSWIALILKFRFKKPLYIRTGYDLFIFSKKDKKSFVKQIFFYLLTYISLNVCDIYSVSSRTDYQFLRKNYKFQKNKIVVRSNWVIVEEQNLHKQNSTYEVLSVGRLEKQKDYEYLINKLNNSKYKLNIVGAGSLEKDLRKISSNNITFHGVMNFEKLNNAYKRYSIYISSTNYEGNPKSILEAMGNGCVVVAPNIENITEVVRNNENGIIYNKLNDDLIEILDNLVNDQKKLEMLSNNAKNYIIENNSLEKNVINVFDDYKLISG